MSTATPKRWNPWPVSIIAYFVAAISGCVFMVAFCNRHPADLITADYYEKELRYQSQMDSMQRALERGQGASVSYDAADRRITVALPVETLAAKPSGRIELYRPSDAALDRQIELQPNVQGQQSIDATGLPPGLWKVRVSWTVGRQDYFIDRKVVIPAKA